MRQRGQQLKQMCAQLEKSVCHSILTEIRLAAECNKVDLAVAKTAGCGSMNDREAKRQQRQQAAGPGPIGKPDTPIVYRSSLEGFSASRELPCAPSQS